MLLATCAPHTEPEYGGNLVHMSRGLVTAAGVPARWSRIDGLASLRERANTDSQTWLAVAAKQPQTLSFFHIARPVRLAQPALPHHAYQRAM
jgi:hypothetical protein